MRRPYVFALSAAAVALGISAVSADAYTPPTPPTTTVGENGTCAVEGYGEVVDPAPDHLVAFVDCWVSDEVTRLFEVHLDADSLVLIAEFVELHDIERDDDADEPIVQTDD